MNLKQLCFCIFHSGSSISMTLTFNNHLSCTSLYVKHDLQHFYYSLYFKFLTSPKTSSLPVVLSSFSFCLDIFIYLFLFWQIFDLSCLLSYLFEQDYAGSDVQMLNKSSCLPPLPGNCKKFSVCSKGILKTRSPFCNLCSDFKNVCKVTITSSHNKPDGNFIMVLLKWNPFERFLDMFDFTS